MSVYDVLAERGFLKQVSHEEEIRELLEKEKITFYIGFYLFNFCFLIKLPILTSKVWEKPTLPSFGVKK